jgi:peptidyl-prolyl cis-trans isomerase SurA
MIMTTTFFQRPFSIRLSRAAALFLMICATPCYAQTVAVMVNGDPITNYDVEQRSKLNFLSTHKPLVRKQVID